MKSKDKKKKGVVADLVAEPETTSKKKKSRCVNCKKRAPGKKGICSNCGNSKTELVPDAEGGEPKLSAAAAEARMELLAGNAFVTVFVHLELAVPVAAGDSILVMQAEAASIAASHIQIHPGVRVASSTVHVDTDADSVDSPVSE